MKWAIQLFVVTLLVTPATATLVEFNEGQHTGKAEVSGDFSATVLWADGSARPFNSIHLTADELLVRTSTVDQYFNMENGPRFASPVEHNETTLHNVEVHVIAREGNLYSAFHPLKTATVTYQSNSIDSVPSMDETYTDANLVEMAEPRTSDVSESLDVASKGHVDAEINGGVSVNLWGWNVRITSDEGVFEYQTGPSRDAEVGPASVGPATQLQVESSNATVSFSGTFDQVHHVWIRDAVAKSDRMDLKLTGEDLPTDQEVFTERSRLTVLDVADTVTANVTQVIPFNPVTSSGPEPAPSTTNFSDGPDEVTTYDVATDSEVQAATAEDVPREWLGWTLAAFALAAALVVAAWIALRVTSWWLVRQASHLDPRKTGDAYRIHAKCTAALRLWHRNGPAYALRARAALMLRKPTSALLDQEQAHRFLRPIIDHDALLRNARDAAVNAVRLDRNESAVAWMHRVKTLQDA